MPYRIDFKPAARRDLKALPREVRRRIEPAIDALARVPRPPGCRKMEGAASTYRLRVGAYRIVYEIEDRVLLVLVVRVGHRREVYRGL